MAAEFSERSVSQQPKKTINEQAVNFSLIFRIELFNALYRRVLCRNRVNDDQMTVTSLQALAKVYKRYHVEIGCFSDTAYILQLLDRVTISIPIRFRCLISFSFFLSVSVACSSRCSVGSGSLLGIEQIKLSAID